MKMMPKTSAIENAIIHGVQAIVSLYGSGLAGLKTKNKKCPFLQ